MTRPESGPRWKRAFLHPWTVAAICLVLGIAGSIVATRVIEQDHAVVGEAFELEGFEYALISLVCTSGVGRAADRDQRCSGRLAIANQTPDQDPPPKLELRLVSGGGDRFSPTDQTAARLAEDIEPRTSRVVEIVFFPPVGLTFHGLDVISADTSKTVRLVAGHGIQPASRSSCGVR